MLDTTSKTTAKNTASTTAKPTAAAQSPGRRPRRRSFAARVPSSVISIVSLIFILAIWELFGRNINPLFASHPSAIFKEGYVMAADGEIFDALIQSLRPLATGYLLAAAVGIPLGLLIGRYRWAEAGLGIYITAGYATPLVALIPLFILWFGLGFAVKVAIVAVLAIFPIAINTWAGAKSVPRTLIELGRTYVGSEFQIMTKIVIPSTLPYIMVGLKLAVGRSIIAIVVAEFFTLLTGLGGIILKAGDSFDTARMFVPVVVLMALGITLTWLVGWLEHRIAPWQRELADSE
jgi:ABC-type nitrate/sulfonate/bicarbonate transport system permease component